MNPDNVPVLSTKDWTAAQVAEVVDRSLARGAGSADPLRHALEAVLAHYCRVLTVSLNRAPDAHLAAFVSLLRAGRMPPVPAVVPLSFKATRTPAAQEGPVVPRYTEVAAAAQGSAGPVVFQTTRDLQVLRAEPVRAMAVDFRRAAVANAAVILSDTPAVDADLFSTAAPLIRTAHIGALAFGDHACLVGLQVNVAIDATQNPRPGTAIEWGITAPTGFVPLTPQRDTTANLTVSGTVEFGALPDWPKAVVRGAESFWLSARTRPTPLPPGDGDAEEAVPCAPIRQLRVTTRHATAALPPQAAMYGRIPLDVTRDCYPFGERPRFGDVFYVASKQFTVAGATIELRIALTNPADGDPAATPLPPVSRDGDPRVRWDIHTAAGWVALAVDDRTEALTVSGTLSFTVPADASPATLGNVTSGWLRARLVSGNYGAGRTVPDAAVLPPVSAPSIASIAVDMSITRGPLEPEHVILDNSFEQAVVSRGADARLAPFCPFPPFDVQGAALYLGLQAARDDVAGCTLHFYVRVKPDDGPPVCRETGQRAAPLRWQARGATGWHDCTAVDETDGLRHSGFIAVSTGDDVATWDTAIAESDRTLWWLRLLPGGDNGSAPRVGAIGRVVLNAVPAVQTLRLEHELLGSSNGRPAQAFHAARSPFIGAVEVDVREGPALPDQEWVRWICVDDFDASTPASPHYVVERLASSVHFGDGRRGRIPPAGGNNLRISYASGGGARGNCPALTVKQLRTTIPYIESATNVDAASGGQDAQDQSSARQSALAWLRHRDRAVCVDDYAVLAHRASPEVARADAFAAGELKAGTLAAPLPPGIVGVSIVPRSAAPRPQPSATLLRTVRQYLDACRSPGAELVLFGPSYLLVGVSAVLALRPEALATRVVALCEQRLDTFLHPLTGGSDGRGWKAGERPHASDFHQVLDGVDGLDHVQSLRLLFETAFADAPGAARPLVAAGRHALCAE
jgi:predicted phage baseplate assembly protein